MRTFTSPQSTSRGRYNNQVLAFRPAGLGPVLRASLGCALLFLLVLSPLFAQKKLTDDMIVDQVRVKLADDPDVGGQLIDVDVHQGAVTLKGKVRTEKQKAKAEKVAKKVKGVTSVINQLVISPD